MAKAGGGIYTEGALTLLNSFVRGNSATERGGGIRARVTASLILDNSQVVDNNADLGGGIFNNGPVELRNNSFVSFNEATTSGGGIYNLGTLTVTDSTLKDNSRPFSGGGIENFGGTLTLNNSTLSGNLAESNGGGIRNSGGTVTVTNSALNGNMAPELGGGGIFNRGETTLNNVTVTFNTATDGAGLYNTDSGTFNISNSIVAQNDGANCFQEAGASFNAFFANLDSDRSCPDFTQGAAGLGPLADNGGPTLTHMLGSSSDALDAGEPSVCAELGDVDQRGYARLNVDGNGNPADGNACDLGAVERNAQPSLQTAVHLPIVVSGR